MSLRDQCHYLYTYCDERIVMVLPQPHHNCCVLANARQGTGSEPILIKWGAFSGGSADTFCRDQQQNVAHIY